MRRYTVSRRSTDGKISHKNCCEKAVNGIQYLIALALVLGYFIFLPTIPFFALFDENFAYLETGYVNTSPFHCTYDYVQIEYRYDQNEEIFNDDTMIFITSTQDRDNTLLSELRSDQLYWDIFLTLAVISSIIGYWIILICPAFQLCLNSDKCVNDRFYCCRRRLKKIYCCSWRIWILTSIISLLFVISALILALEKPCEDEIKQLYEDHHNQDSNSIDISQQEFGYCLWYLLIVLILNIMIICICGFMRNDDVSQYKQSFYKKTFHSQKSGVTVWSASGGRGNDNGYGGKSVKGCDYCHDKRYVRKGCCQKTKCPICTEWEMDDF